MVISYKPIECCKSKEIVPKKTDKVVSEIEKKGQPYKEIEAVFNNNRVVIRTQKEPRPQFEPPCECIGEKPIDDPMRVKDKGVAFDMEDGVLEFCREPREPTDPSAEKKICQEAACRTVTLYPQVDDNLATRARRFSKPSLSIEKEKNPNIFLLKIRKFNENSDRLKIDFEFRTPRPWQKQKLDEAEDKKDPTVEEPPVEVKPVEEIEAKKKKKKAKK